MRLRSTKTPVGSPAASCQDLHAVGRHRVARHAGAPQRHRSWRPSRPAACSSSPRCRGGTRDGRARRRRGRRASATGPRPSTPGASQVERRRAERHRDDPLAGLAGAPRAGAPASARRRSSGSAASEGWISFSPSRSRWACASTRPGMTVAPRRSITRVRRSRQPRTSRGAPTALMRPPCDGQRARPWAGRGRGEDASVGENPVGRYFIHPFSR